MKISIFFLSTFIALSSAVVNASPARINTEIEGRNLQRLCHADYDCQIPDPKMISAIIKSFQVNYPGYLKKLRTKQNAEIINISRNLPRLDKEIQNPANSPASENLLRQIYDHLLEELRGHQTNTLPETFKRFESNAHDLLKDLDDLHYLASEYHKPLSPEVNPAGLQAYKLGLLKSYTRIAPYLDTQILVLESILNNKSYFKSDIQQVFLENIPEYKKCKAYEGAGHPLMYLFNPHTQFRSLMFLAAHNVNGYRVPLTPKCTTAKSKIPKAFYDHKKHVLSIEIKKSGSLSDTWTIVSQQQRASDEEINKAVGFSLKPGALGEN